MPFLACVEQRAVGGRGFGRDVIQHIRYVVAIERSATKTAGDVELASPRRERRKPSCFTRWRLVGLRLKAALPSEMRRNARENRFRVAKFISSAGEAGVDLAYHKRSAIRADVDSESR